MKTRNPVFFILIAAFVFNCLCTGVLFAQTAEEKDIIPLKQSATATSPLSRSVGEPDRLTISMIVLGMLLAGFILLFLEVAILPGFGVAGFAAIALIIGGLALAFWKLETNIAIVFTIITLTGSIAFILWMLYVFPHTSLGKKFVLETRITVEDGYAATEDHSRFVGVEGVTVCDLRPSGTAKFGDDRIDVTSDGEYIPRGTKIRGVKIRNASLVVETIVSSQ
ncbi:MAG: hypothetical protein HQM10_20740 [Candidatus Riflebacteria bacterium]|nr:hypothetical protein [Candidatus Riflebacteria bacterium]